MKKKNPPLTEEEYLSNCRFLENKDLYMRLRKTVFEGFSETETAATKGYISWSITGARQFANIEIHKKNICVLTRAPKKEYSIGSLVPSTHEWILNYRTYITSEDDFAELKNIIRESYDKVLLNRRMK